MRQLSLSFKRGHVDLKVIETIFDAAVEVFSEYSHQEAAKTALAVLTYQAPGGEQYTTVKNDFPGLSAKDDQIRKGSRSSRKSLQEKEQQLLPTVFAALAGALQSNNQQS